MDESSKVAGIRQAEDQGVKMVRHGAVRKNFKILVRGEPQKLIDDVSHYRFIGKRRGAKVYAYCEEIAVLPNVGEVAETKGMM